MALMMKLTGLETIVSLINIHILLLRIFPGKLRKVWPAVIFTLALSGALLMYVLPLDEGRAVLALLPITFVIFSPLLTVKSLKKRQILYVTILYSGVSASITGAGFWLANSFGLGVKIYTEAAINAALLFSGFLIIKIDARTGILDSTAVLPLWSKRLLLFVVYLCDFAVTLLSKFFENTPKSLQTTMIEAFSAAMVTAVAVLYPVVLFVIASRAYHKRAADVLGEQLKIQVDYHAAEVRANQKVRRFQHDYKNFKARIAQTIPLDEHPQLKALFEDMDLDALPKKAAFDTGNPVMDGFLSWKQAAAEKQGAQIVFSGLIPSRDISTDIYILLGNATDNALEACAKLPYSDAKRIAVSCDCHDGFFFLKMTNPVSGDVRIHNNSVITSKEDKKAHGFGLSTMQRIVNSNYGSMKLFCENNVFCVDIVLEIETYKEKNQPNEYA